MIELQANNETTRLDVLGFVATIYNALIQNGYLEYGVSVVINNEAWVAKEGIDRGIYLTCMNSDLTSTVPQVEAFWVGDHVEYDIQCLHLRYNGDVGSTVTPPLPENPYNYAVMDVYGMTGAIIRMLKRRYDIDVIDWN